jgi:hypothetical protein
MKRVFIALALAGAFLMPTAPAAAQDLSPVDVGVLILTAKGLGIKFNSDGPKCIANPRLMGFFVPQEGSVTICFKNAAQSGVGPLQVLRHELIHAAQLCHGGALLSEDRSATYDLSNYPQDQHRTEAEARDLSVSLSNVDVARLLAKSCSNTKQ